MPMVAIIVFLESSLMATLLKLYWTHQCTNQYSYSQENGDQRLVLAPGQGNLQVNRVWTGKTVWFGSRPIQKPELLLLRSPNLALYQSTCGFCRVWLDRSGPMSGPAVWVDLYIVSFRYPTVHREILTMVSHCSVRMYWPPLWSNRGETPSLPHPGNESQQWVNNCWSCILGNLSGHRLQIVITEVLASFIGKTRSNTLPAPSWKWGSTECQRFSISYLRLSKWHMIADL